MNYKKFFFFVYSFFSLPIISQVKFDTVSVKEVSAGVFHYFVQEKNVPWNINFLKIDLHNPNIKIKTIKAEDKLVARETTSSMAARSSNDTNLVVGAINADFFDGDGIPVGAQVSDGQLVSSSVAPSWTKIGFDINKNPMIGRINFSGEVIASGHKNALNAVNQTRSADFLVLYNSFFGASTNTNEWGTEISLKPITSWIVNDTVILVVKNKFQRIGNASINPGEVVLSGHGLAENFINNFIQVGDTIKLVVKLNSGLSKLWQMVSGFPIILKNGVNYALQGYSEENGSATFATDRHPRTAAGISADSNYLFLAVVDGRQIISKGMSLIEFADFFKRIGAYNAVNLDGGGSSTILVRNKIVNFPSDGTERKVSNCLLVLTKEDFAFSELKIFPDSVLTEINKNIQFKLSAKDVYGYANAVKFSDINYELTNSSIGSIDANGNFTPLADGESYLIVTKGAIADTAKIIVKTKTSAEKLDGFGSIGSWKMTGKNIDTLNSSIEISNVFFSEGNSSLKINYSYEYQSGNSYWIYLNNDFPIWGVPEKIVVDAKSDGWNHSVAFVATDENGEEFAFLSNKTPTQTEFFDSLTAATKNPVKINSASNFFYPITIKQIAITLANDRQPGKIYSGSIYFDNFRVVYPSPVDVESEKYFPVNFALEQNYPNPFGNPIHSANSSTTIKYSIPNLLLTGSKTQPDNVTLSRSGKLQSNLSMREMNVTLKVFDILGREVATLVNESKPAGTYEVKFDASAYGRKMSSGIYFYRLTCGDYSVSKKLVFLK